MAAPMSRHSIKFVVDIERSTMAKVQEFQAAVNQYDPRRHQLGMEEPLVLPVIVYRRHVRIPE